MLFALDNLSWISFNIMLSFIPVILVFTLRRKMNLLFRGALLFLWFLFLPNSIYLVTDLQYLPYQVVRVAMSEQVLLLLEFMLLGVLGVVTYLYSLEPFEYLLKQLKIVKANKNFFYIILNFIVAFGVILGKSQRTHSWYVFTNFERVIRDVHTTFASWPLMIWVIAFGFIANILFFLFRPYFSYLNKQKKKRS